MYSEPERGTVFKIFFPAIGDGAEELVYQVHDIARLEGDERVLVVEDDPLVRSLAVNILGHLGYDVLEALDVEDAVRIARESDAPIDLLLTDVVMPGMNGLELWDRVLQLHPDSKSLFMSGYTEDALTIKVGLGREVNFLSKPFSSHGLGKKVRQVLDDEQDGDGGR